MTVESVMPAKLGKLAHRMLNAIGVEVRLLRNIRAAYDLDRRNREIDAWRILGANRFATVLDIGANEGQFATIAREIWPTTLVHSFEPLPDVYAALVAKFRDDPGVVAHNLGLSDRSQMQSMHRSAFSPSSSLLPMAELHRREWPQSVEHTDVEVRLERLDDWMRDINMGRRAPMLVKIDVQGFEMSVIDGGAETLRAAAIAVIEVSFHELYEKQPLFAQIHDRMRQLGFVYRGNIEQFASRDRTRVLYADAIFENVGPSYSKV